MEYSKKEITAAREKMRELNTLAQLRAVASEAGINAETASLDELLVGYLKGMEQVHKNIYLAALKADKPRDIESIQKYFATTEPAKHEPPQQPAQPRIPTQQQIDELRTLVNTLEAHKGSAARKVL